jgi:site-specific DNA recombinase
MTITEHKQESGLLAAAISKALAEMPTAKPDASAALVYARMSMDTAGKELGLTRQIAGEDGALRLCAVRGWTVTEDHIFHDNDLSASTGIFRQRYADMMAAVERGEARIIVTYQLSRLWRHRRERAEGMEILKTHRVKVVTVKGPELDLSTAYGRAMVGLLGEFDTMESEVKGERMRSSILQKAHAGQQSGGGQRPFGYQLQYIIKSKPGERVRRRITRVKVHPTEGRIVQECARRVLAGEHISAIVRDLNGRNILTSAGNNWNRTTLRRMLCSARISGRREHIPRNSYETVRPLIGEIVWAPKEDPEIVWEPEGNIDQNQSEADSEPEGDTDEDELEGTLRWPAIISAADSDRLRTLLTRPDRRLTTGGARKHLLSGILHCARCGRPMVGRSSRGVLRYVCNRNPDGGKDACGRMFITSAPTDEHIRDLVLAALDSPEMVARLRQREAPEPDLHARIRADEDELEVLATDHGRGEISRAEWKAVRAPIVARLDAARERLAQSTQGNALEGFVGTLEEMTARWNGANTSQRRAVITSVLEKVMVHPATVMGRNRFDSDRLEPVWRA